MENQVKAAVDQINELIVAGQLIEAGKQFFAEQIQTIEFDGTVTKGNAAVSKKLADFVDTIDKVNKAELIVSAVRDNVAFSEFLLDFTMKDGSSFHLHEIIRTAWENGKIIEEHYFNG